MSRFVQCLTCGLVALLLALAPIARAEGEQAKSPQPAKAVKAASADVTGDVKAEKQAGRKAGKAKAKGGNKADAEKPEAKTEAKPDAKPEVKPAAGKSESTAEKPATHTVQSGPFKVELSLKGQFEGQTNLPVQVRLQEWKSLEVRKAVAHGTAVKQGEVILEFKLDDVDRAIADMKTDRRLAELTFKLAEETLRLAEAATPMELEEAARAKRIADEDLANYLKSERPMAVRVEEYSLKLSQQQLEYQEEELRQLEKMYKADEVTEETEEIILTRQRNTVDLAKFMVEMAKLSHDLDLKFAIPRNTENKKTAARREDLDLRRAKAALPAALSKSRIDFEKLKVEQARADKKLKKLEADREAMTVKAPGDGVVYYGQYVHGDWTGASTAAERLKLGGSVSSGDVVMTIVKPRPLQLRADVAEKDLHWFEEGLKATVEPTAYPDLRLTANVAKVDSLPNTGNKYEAVFHLAGFPGREAAPLMPGMNCTVKLVPYLEKEAVSVPSSMVFSDELRPEKKYVYLVTGPGKHRKLPVTVGQKSDDRVEILRGLRDGDEILKEKPKGK